MTSWARSSIFRSGILRYRPHRLTIKPLVRAQQHAADASITVPEQQRPIQIRIDVEPTYRPRRISWLNPAMVALGAIPILSFVLGVWQVKRLKWKVNLIDELAEKLEREPIVLPSSVNLSAISDFIYRKVLLRGHWDHERSMLLGPRVRDGTPGFNIITPLIREDGATVLVNRGWISQEFASPEKRNESAGLVEVQGMLRTAPTRNMFTPDNRPERGEWYWADVNTMMEFAGGEKARVQPVYVEEIFEGHFGDVSRREKHGIPIGKAAVVDLRNSHLSYAITWFSLSAFTTYMFMRLMLKKRGRALKGMPRR